jgi:hypothetical protein
MTNFIFEGWLERKGRAKGGPSLLHPTNEDLSLGARVAENDNSIEG